MVSLPAYDPQRRASSQRLQGTEPGPGRPALQPRHAGRLPARLDDEGGDGDRGDRQRQVRHDTMLNADSGVEISGVPLANSGGQDFGDIGMEEALTNSVNTYWAQVGEDIGTDTMYEYMDRFGFNFAAAPRLPVLPARDLGRVRPTAAARGRLRPDRRRPHGDRPGQAQRDAAADGDGRRGGRQRRRADGAAPVVEGDRHRRPRGEARPRADEPRDERGHRRGR